MELDLLTMHWARCHDRVPFVCPVELRILPHGPTMLGESSDISLGGVGCTTNEPLDAEMNVRIVFLRKQWQSEFQESVTGRVISAEPDVAGWRVGIEFHTVVGRACQPQLAAMIRDLYLFYGLV